MNIIKKTYMVTVTAQETNEATTSQFCLGFPEGGPPWNTADMIEFLKEGIQSLKDQSVKEND